VDETHFRILFDYGYWARDRVLARVQELKQAQYEAPMAFTYGSIRGMLVHCLDAEQGWLRRFEGVQRPGPLTEDSVLTVAALTELWHEEEQRMRAYLGQLTPGMLAGDLVFQGRSGREVRLPNLWLSLAHVVNHSTQHRSEAAEALTTIGLSPGDLDLGLYAGELAKMQAK